MTPELDLFLHAADLDDAMTAAARLSDLSDSDQHAIRRVLHALDDDQAVANLLMHPDLMPADVRRDALMRGLEQPARSYLALAAVVGLQHAGRTLPERDHERVIERLYEIAQQSPPPTAQRASLTLHALANAEDAPRIGVLLMHPDPTVKHNIVATLAKVLGVNGARRVVERLHKEQWIFGEEKRYAEAQLRQIETTEADAWNAAATPLLGYIPNLSEFEAASPPNPLSP